MSRRPWNCPGKQTLSVGLAAALLGGCATTTILSSENPSGSRPAAWKDFFSLQVKIWGAVPGATNTEISSMFPTGMPAQYAALGALPLPPSDRRIVLFINPAERISTALLCRTPPSFQPAQQEGRYAIVTGALCNGDQLVTWARARILTAGATPEQLKHNVNMVRVQLFYSLAPGGNHPSRLFAGQMYG